MLELSIKVHDSVEMHELGRQIGQQLSAGDLVILTGEMGAGKTTFTRGLGEGLGVRGPVTSPTFVLARTHPSVASGPPLTHVDAYRLTSAAEFEDLDLDFKNTVVVVEWGRAFIAQETDAYEITITHAANETGESEDFDPETTEEPRVVSIIHHGSTQLRELQIGELQTDELQTGELQTEESKID